MADGIAAVQRLHADLLSAWNDRDAHRYAALFAADAAMIGFDGSHIAAPQIEQHLASIFTNHPTAAYVWKVQETRPLATGVVLLRALIGMVPPGQTDVNPAVNAVQSLVAVCQDEIWRVALFHNTPAQYHGRPELADEHTALMRTAMLETT